MKVYFALKIPFEAINFSELLQILIDRFCNFYFYLIAHSVLVLDMLTAPHASEYASTNHDTHLGGESFSFFHRMR